MNRRELIGVIEQATGLTVHNVVAPKGTKVPYITIKSGKDNNFFADNQVWSDPDTITLTITNNKTDFGLLDKIEKTLNEHEVGWSMEDGSDPALSLYINEYTMEV